MYLTGKDTKAYKELERKRECKR